MSILPKMLALFTLPVMVAGCAIDVTKLVQQLTKPTVAFENPTAWECPAETTRLVTKQGTDDCLRCTNASGENQTVTINKTPPSSVVPGKQVYICDKGTVIVQGQPTPLP